MEVPSCGDACVGAGGDVGVGVGAGAGAGVGVAADVDAAAFVRVRFRDRVGRVGVSVWVATTAGGQGGEICSAGSVATPGQFAACSATKRFW